MTTPQTFTTDEATLTAVIYSEGEEVDAQELRDRGDSMREAMRLIDASETKKEAQDIQDRPENP